MKAIKMIIFAACEDPNNIYLSTQASNCSFLMGNSPPMDWTAPSTEPYPSLRSVDANSDDKPTFPDFIPTPLFDFSIPEPCHSFSFSTSDDLSFPSFDTTSSFYLITSFSTISCTFFFLTWIDKECLLCFIIEHSTIQPTFSMVIDQLNYFDSIAHITHQYDI